MKKIFALLLSVLMLFSMVAVAEEAQDTALVNLLSNIVLETGSDGETAQIALEGLEVYASLDTSDGLSLVFQGFNGDDSLLLAVLKLAGTQLQFAIDGVDKTFVQDIPALEGQDTAALGEALRPMLPTLLNAQLPAIPVGSLPKLDVTPFVGMIGTVAEDGSATFSIPHEMVDSLLDQIIELGQTAGESVPGLDQLLSALEHLRASGLSVALEGTVVDDGDKQTISVEIYPFSDGTLSEEAAAIVNFVSAQDAISVTVDLPSEDEAMTIADLEIGTDAAANALTATLDIAGMMQFSLGVFQEDGLQKIALNMDSAFDAGFATGLAYGENGNGNVFDLTFTAGEDTAFELLETGSTVSEDATAGTIEVTVDSQGSTFHLTADVQSFLGSIDLGDFTMPADTVSFDEISGEENSAALEGALEPLIAYLGQVFTGAAA